MSYSGARITITRRRPSSTNYELELYPVQAADVTQRKSSFSITPPGQPAREGIFLSVSGMEADISIDATLYDDGTDRSNGTAPNNGFLAGEAVTVQEQFQYLDQVIHGPDIATEWVLTDTEGWFIGADGTPGETVFFEEFSSPVLDETAERWRPIRLRFRRGRTVG